MNASAKEILQYVQEEDVKFVRLAFCDVFGKQKNISILSGELERAFAQGVMIDASAIRGFGGENVPELPLRLSPDPTTIAVLPWRPDHGRVVRMFCRITYADGRPLEADTRTLLQNVQADARQAGITFTFGSESEFYLLETDERGNPTDRPFDQAGYMDIAPADKGENMRREICLTLEQMGIQPERSHHQAGPGQNEIDFRYASPLQTADHTVTFRSVVRTAAARNGLYADFSPKPLADQAGNSFRIRMAAQQDGREDVLPFAVAGILEQLPAMSAFLNPTEGSYQRLEQEKKAPLLRMPALGTQVRYASLCSPDSCANPYVAFALLMRAGLCGARARWAVEADALQGLYDRLPPTLSEAQRMAMQSPFIRECLPQTVIDAYCGKTNG